MKTATETPVTIQQAFESAKEEHSTPVEQAPRTDASTEATTTASAPAQDTEKAAGAPPITAKDEPSDLMSETDWTALSTLDPAKQRAELNKRWTQKTQELAAQKKALEAKQGLLTALESGDQRTIQALAERAGLTIAPPPAEKTAADVAATIADQVTEKVKAALGPDLDFLAGPMSAAIREVAELVSKQTVDSAVKPLQEQTSQITRAAAEEQVKAIEATFTQQHPDWKQYEPRMIELGQTMQPGQGMTELQYLEALYKLASFDDQVKAAGAKAVTSLAKAAEKAETTTQSVKESTVQKTAPANASLMDAYHAAKRGEKWEG